MQTELIETGELKRFLEARGLKISMVKLDPYINVDPGTMSPFQHGEVFVTADGTETDLDLSFRCIEDRADGQAHQIVRLVGSSTGSSGATSFP